MKRYLSDYLPASTVNSLRRCLHAPAYIVLMCLLLVAVCGAERDEMLDLVWECSWFLLFIIPLVAGGWSCREACEATSMARLAPLSSWRAVFGVWLSATLQCLLIGLLLCAVFVVHQVEDPSAWRALSRVLLLSLVAVPGWMASLSLGGAARWAAIVIGAVGMGASISMGMNGGVLVEIGAAHAWTVQLGPAFIGAVLLLMVLLLNVARRAYALPTENLWLLPRVLTPLLVLILFVGIDESCDRSWWRILLAGGLLLLNVLLPYSRRVPVRAVLPGVPVSWQRPGVLPDLGVTVLTAAALLYVHPGLCTESMGWVACESLLGLALMLTCCRSESTSKWLVFWAGPWFVSFLLEETLLLDRVQSLPEPYRMWLLPAVASLLLLWIVAVACWRKC